VRDGNNVNKGNDNMSSIIKRLVKEVNKSEDDESSIEEEDIPIEHLELAEIAREKGIRVESGKAIAKVMGGKAYRWYFASGRANKGADLAELLYDDEEHPES